LWAPLARPIPACPRGHPQDLSRLHAHRSLHYTHRGRPERGVTDYARDAVVGFEIIRVISLTAAKHGCGLQVSSERIETDFVALRSSPRSARCSDHETYTWSGSGASARAAALLNHPNSRTCLRDRPIWPSAVLRNGYV